MTETDSLKERLLGICINGHPNAVIPWPHNILHEAHDRIAALEGSLFNSILDYELLGDDYEQLQEDNRLLAEIKALYNELIMAVQTKNPNETRHQTALRLIMESERGRHTSHQTEQGAKCDRSN